jgi:hypothetical protein
LRARRRIGLTQPPEKVEVVTGGDRGLAAQIGRRHPERVERARLARRRRAADLWHQQRARLPFLRARLIHPRRRRAQIGIVRQRPLDQPGHHRIAEARPPIDSDRRSGAKRGAPRRRRGHGGAGRRIRPRPDTAAHQRQRNEEADGALHRTRGPPEVSTRASTDMPGRNRAASA